MKFYSFDAYRSQFLDFILSASPSIFFLSVPFFIPNIFIQHILFSLSKTGQFILAKRKDSVHTKNGSSSSSSSSKIVYYSVTYQIYIKIYIHKTKLYLISSQL